MFDYLDYMSAHNHQQLVFCTDPDSGLVALIAVHDTTLGPALGGTRLWQYEDHDAAVLDALRLSEGMTYKAAVAGLSLGGGKAVILADGRERDPQIRAARFRAYGRFVESLGGRYITAEDVGTKTGDMHIIRSETRYVTGLPLEDGGSGDPSPMTAFGVLRGIQALVEDVLDRDSLAGVRVAVQGLGKVGLGLTRYLAERGAFVTATDINMEVRHRAEQEFGIETVSPELIYDVPCDIFSPCALGAVINDETIPRLSCKVIAGSANNQLAEPRHADILHERGIVYAVDYVINAGGLINVSYEVEGHYDETAARAKTSTIYYTIQNLLDLARTENVNTSQAAMLMAQNALRRSPVESPEPVL